MPDWLTQQVRLTGFTKPPLSPLFVRDWWHDITGAPPRAVTETPHRGTIETGGLFAGEPLHVGAEHGRVDVSRPFAAAEVPQLPTLVAALPAFAEIMGRWLDQDGSPGFQRLAIGGLAAQGFPSVDDCRDSLDRYLPSIDMAATETRDFQYQVNHRCRAKINNELLLNRIMKWSIADLGERGPFAISLEFDISTPADHKGNLGNAADLFREMASYADHFAQKGDRP